MLVAGIGEMVVSRDPSTLLVAYGLGSCVALAAWDPQTRLAALAHFMLPSGPLAQPPVKFVDSGLPTFLAEFAGPADRRAAPSSRPPAAPRCSRSSPPRWRSASATRRPSRAPSGRQGLRLHRSDLGGKAGRTVQLEPATGRLLIKSVSSVSVL